MHAIVDTAQQHRLVAKLQAGICQHGTGFLTLRGDLIGMIEVSIQPDRVVLFEHLAKFRGNALWHDYRCTGAQADDFNVLDFAQFGQDVLQALFPHQEGITAGKQHIANHRFAANVVDTGINFLQGARAILLACQTAAGAVTAIHGALIGNQKEHPVGVAMG